jgi:protein-disulfide isomerase
VLAFEDPLCPTCKALHERLAQEGIFENLDLTLALFPLDNECNWMLSEAMHPGACLLSRAILCGGDERARDVLEWTFAEQESLAALGKSDKAALRAAIVERFGGELGECLEARATTQRLNHHLHFAANNSIAVSTPQLYVGTQRICDEDTDIGLRFTLAHLAPEVLQ